MIKILLLVAVLIVVAKYTGINIPIISKVL